MPSLQVEIDQATGELTIHIEGIAGPSCEEVEKKIRELMGTPDRSERTRDFYARERQRQGVRQ